METLKELIPPLGPRMKAAKKIKELNSEQNETTVVTQDSQAYQSTLQSPTFSLQSPKSLITTSTPEHSNTPKRPKLHFDIRKILNDNNGGDIIESEMDEGLLSHKYRIQAVRMFVSHLIEQFGDRPTSHVKEALARSIVNEFPKLKGEDGDGYEAWYTSSIGQHAATGYLEERLRNVRKRTAKKNHVSIRKANKTNSDSTASSVSSLESDEDDIEPAAIEAMVQWMKHNKEPLGKVREYHQKTAKSRLMWIRENPEGVAIFAKYPRLLDTSGLINLDFEVIKPKCGDKLFLLWTPAVARNLLHYADKQNDWSRHLGIVQDSSQLSDDEVCNIALQCIPCILPVGSQKIKGKGKRATIEDALTSFVDLQKIGTNIPHYLEGVKQKQPFVLAIGSSRVSPEQTYIIIEREAIPQESLLNAIDLCFKCFHVFDMNYQWQSYNTWQFLQTVVYNLPGKMSSSVVSLKTYLKVGRK
ncbi:uncharacterized protein [Apostichopus japonicus]